MSNRTVRILFLILSCIGFALFIWEHESSADAAMLLTSSWSCFIIAHLLEVRQKLDNLSITVVLKEDDNESDN